MAACIFLGDSIALGAGQAVNARGGPACAVVARVGARGPEIVRQASSGGTYLTAVISAGSNGPADPALLADLDRARRALRVARVVWILPYNRQAAYAVTRIAFSYGDDLVDLALLPSADGVHPASYAAVAIKILR